MTTSKDKKPKKQKGGSGTDFAHLWYSSTPTNIQTLSKYTAERIDGSPMFNPLRPGMQVPTPTSGVIPTGVHLGNRPATNNIYLPEKPLYLVGGGEREYDGGNTNAWVEFARKYARNKQMTFKEALSSPSCQRKYYRSTGRGD